MDAPSFSVLTSLGSALHFLLLSFTSGLFSTYILAGCTIVVIACLIYLFHPRDSEDDYFTIKAVRSLTTVMHTLTLIRSRRARESHSSIKCLEQHFSLFSVSTSPSHSLRNQILNILRLNQLRQLNSSLTRSSPALASPCYRRRGTHMNGPTIPSTMCC